MTELRDAAPRSVTRISDLDLLYTFEGAARASVAAWAAAAAQVEDPKLRQRLADMVAPSLAVQGKARDLIRRLGGQT